MFSHGSLERFFKRHGVKWDPISDFRYQSLNVTFLAPLTANRRFQMNFQQPEDCFAATVLQFSIVDWVSPTSLKKYEGSTFGNFKTNKSLKGGTYTPTSRGVAIRNACLDLMTESTESIQNHLLFYPKTEKKNGHLSCSQDARMMQNALDCDEYMQGPTHLRPAEHVQKPRRICKQNNSFYYKPNV